MTKTKIAKLIFCLLIGSKICAAAPCQPIFQYGNALENPQFNKITRPINQTKTEKKYTTYFIKNSLPQNMQETLRSLFPDLRMAADLRTRSLTIYATQTEQESIQKIIDKLDKPIPQIKVEVQVIELHTETFDQYRHIFADLTSGFQINYDFNAGRLIPMSQLEGKLIGLIKNGSAKVVARPTITTLDNQKALITVGDKIPYVTPIVYQQAIMHQLQQIDTGIEVEITPKIVSHNLVLTEIQTAISTVKLWKEYNQSEYPVLSSRKAKTSVYIQNNETLIIAGLLDEATKENRTAIPILSSLPIIGTLFQGISKEKTQSDILFLITPSILQ